MQEKINPALSYPIEDSPASGGAVEVAAGVFWLRLPIPFELNHINVWLLEEEDGFTLIDTGIDSSKARAVWEEVFRSVMKNKALKRIIVTHFHPDHFGLAKWLCERSGASYLASAETLERTSFLLNTADQANIETRLQFYRDQGVEDQTFFEEFLKGSLYAQVVSGCPAHAEQLHEGDTVDIGGHGWQVIMTYGHAPGHINLYCESLNLLISGDQILPTITSNVSVLADQPEANPLLEYMESFEKFAHLPEDTVVLPSHGRVFAGVHTRIAEVLTHHQEKLERVLELCEQPHSSRQLMPKLFRRKLEGINTILAFGETLANLNYLHQQGRLQRKRMDGHYVYQQ